jgi:nitrite reductase (NADH) small subunit
MAETMIEAASANAKQKNARQKNIKMVGLLEEAKTNVTFNLGSVEKIPPGEGREYEVAGKLIAVFRERSGRLYATQARCPHRDGHLADGIVGAGRVICPLHAFKFELGTGQPLGNDCPALVIYAVRLNENGEILLTE